MVSQMSEASSLSISITTWSSAPDMFVFGEGNLAVTLTIHEGFHTAIAARSTQVFLPMMDLWRVLRSVCALADVPLSPSSPFHHPSPRSELWFAVVDVSIVMALPIASLLCTEGSLVSVSSFVVLCTVRQIESSVSQRPFPVCIPDIACTFRSSFLWIEICFFFFAQPPFHCRLRN